MRRAWRVFAVVLVVIAVPLLSAGPGLAGAGASYSAGLTYWPVSVSARSGGSQFASWNSRMVGLELRKMLPNSPLGFGGEYFSGPQSPGTGSWASLHADRPEH